MRWAHWTADLRRAVRTLGRSPVFTATTVGMLGLTIGAATAMFAVVQTVLLDPLPYAEPERLLHIEASAPGSEMPDEFGVSAEFYVHYREHSTLLEELSTYNSFTNTLRTPDRVERIRMSYPTNSMYATLGVQPILGRLPVEADANDVVVISHALWTDWFGADPDVIGRSVFVGGRDRSIIGVMGPEFRFPDDGTRLWIASSLDAGDIQQPGNFGIPLVARMKPGVTQEQVATELAALAQQLPARFGGSAHYAEIIARHRPVVRSLEDEFLGRDAGPLWILLATAVIVLMIACGNVANLFLVRTEGRHRELAVRRALGAGRRALMRLQMAEALVVAGLAALLAVALAAVALPAFLQVVPDGIPRIDQLQLGPEPLLFAFVAALLSALACGFAPALRGSVPDLARLREGGRSQTGRSHRLRDGLVVAQTALALLLLIGSALLFRSAAALQSVDPGYDGQDIFTFQIAPDRPELEDARAQARFNLAFLDRLAALPGVESVGLVENFPINEGTDNTRVRTEGMAVEADAGTLVQYTYAAGDYFRSMGIALLAGRPLEESDHSSSLGNIVVSESAAALLWPGQDAVGKRLLRQGQEQWETVVGVVEDVLQDGLQDPAQPTLYLPMVDQTATGGRPIESPAYVVRTARADRIAPEIRALVREVAPEAPMYRTFTIDGLLADSMARLSFTLLTLSVAALLALVLGAVGLYGVLSYIVAERTREIGLRMALGATAREVRRIVVAQGARVVAAGVAIGLLAALALTHLLRSLLFGIEPVDPASFLLMPLAMVLVGLLACYLPARKASNMDPVESLRSE